MATQVEYGNPEVLYHFDSQELEADDEEVYQVCGGPGSITDIWKKFELIPTPPLSPSRQTTTSGASSPICLTSSPADTLQNVSEILDVDNSRTTALFSDNSCLNLKSNLIQDCMWGSHSSTEKKSRTRTAESFYDTPCSTPPTFLTLDYVSSDCVDPTSVFPYHINNHEFASDSSSEDEDEIDVVTIEKPVKRKTSFTTEIRRNNSNNNTEDEDSQDAEFEEPVAKKPRSVTKRHHRTVKETHLSAKEISSRLAAKDRFEDPECKRTVHNVLERKRRNDLKYSFQVLRDSVPELKGSERAPKVSILKKATDCILKLNAQEEYLLKQKDILERRHEALLRKLKSLEES